MTNTQNSSFQLGLDIIESPNVATFVATLILEAGMYLTVRKRGNSLSVIIPKEMATSMQVDDGDTLFVTKTPTGYEISPYDPEFVQKIEAARRGMKKYRNALNDLAQ